MCLGIPGQIVEIVDETLQIAKVLKVNYLGPPATTISAGF
jgi:hydrogenase maturation factor